MEYLVNRIINVRNISLIELPMLGVFETNYLQGNQVLALNGS